jgi:MoxR-like ATPase
MLASTQMLPSTQQRGRTFQATTEIVEIVNAALYLRRPLLVTGNPGSGKSSLIDAIAYELQLGEPLRWSVTSRSTLRDALYQYDAVARLQATQQAQIEGQGAETSLAQFLRLGPLGTALLPTNRPRALLIDEIDKADLDLPNDMLNILEEGQFDIPELARLSQKTVNVRAHGSSRDTAEGSGDGTSELTDKLTSRLTDEETYPIERGQVKARQFPLVVFTSNGEREFPPAFLRRCLRLQMPDPCADVARLTEVVEAHLRDKSVDESQRAAIKVRIEEFAKRATTERLATDQLLNAVLLVVLQAGVPDSRKDELLKAITQPLN